MDLPTEVITPFRLIAYGVPALMFLGGILMLLHGYSVELAILILSEWSLVIFGSMTYVSELVLLYYGNR